MKDTNKPDGKSHSILLSVEKRFLIIHSLLSKDLFIRRIHTQLHRIYSNTNYKISRYVTDDWHSIECEIFGTLAHLTLYWNIFYRPEMFAPDSSDRTPGEDRRLSTTRASTRLWLVARLASSSPEARTSSPNLTHRKLEFIVIGDKSFKSTVYITGKVPSPAVDPLCAGPDPNQNLWSRADCWATISGNLCYNKSENVHLKTDRNQIWSKVAVSPPPQLY